jgi:hypothetical protein
MQIRVAATATTPLRTGVTLANLQTAWAKTGAKKGVFETAQDPIIIPQAGYNTAYNNTFSTAAADQFIQVNMYSKTFQPINTSGVLQPLVTLPIQPKASHDEMGGVYDTKYGRMSAMLGLELPASSSTISQFLPYGYASPPVDLLGGSVSGTLVGTTGDGTQIWNISQNGVDTHTIHVHLFNAQLINRVGWDGAMLPPDPSELGWKETFRVNPLEQTFIAMRPISPTVSQIPFLDKVPNSVRLIDPTMPAGAVLDAPPPAGWFDPAGNAITQILNHYVNYGWEYVYHCHLLAHEEMDMMHATSFAVTPATPGLIATATGSGSNRTIQLSWTLSPNTTDVTVQRATNKPFTAGLVSHQLAGPVTTYSETVPASGTFYYRVVATNTTGDKDTPGFPTMTVSSGVSNLASYPVGNTQPLPPSNLTVASVVKNLSGPNIGQIKVTFNWTDNSNNETGFTIQRALDSNFTVNVNTWTVAANATTFTSPDINNKAYYVRIRSFNSTNPSPWVNATPFPTAVAP